MNLDKIFNYKKNKKCDLVELFIEKEKNLSFELNKEGILENFTESNNHGIGIRIIKNYKQSLIYTNDFNEKSIFDSIEKCHDIIDYLDEEKNLCFLENEFFEGIIDENNLKKIKKTSFSDKFKFLEKNKKDINNNKEIAKIESITYDEIFYETQIINSKGLKKKEIGGYCGSSCSLSIINKKEIETGSYYHYDRNIENLFNKKIAKEAYKRAYSMLGSKIINTDKYKILLTPEVSISFLYLLSNSFDGENIYKGKSLFKNKFGRKIINSKITIIDDGTKKDTIGKTFFDSEGVFTKKNILIKNGIFEKGLYNLTIAKLCNVSNTANCSRGFKSLPNISFHNLYIKKGKTNQKDLIFALEKGLIINDLMGIHMVDTISGDFSMGASGFFVEKNKIIKSFRGVTISGNLLELFNKIQYVGDDLIFKTTIGAPSLIINEVVISGS